MNQGPGADSLARPKQNIGGIDPPCLENPILPLPKMLDLQERIWDREDRLFRLWRQNDSISTVPSVSFVQCPKLKRYHPSGFPKSVLRPAGILHPRSQK